MVGFRINTPVLMGDGTYKNIQDIQVNDSVMSWDETNHCLVPQTVVNTLNNMCNELTLYTFDNGDVLYGCENLVFLTSTGWKENIEIGDLVITKNGTTTVLIDEAIVGQETIYELDIEDIDNYIVENIIVHNVTYTLSIYNSSGVLQHTYYKSVKTGKTCTIDGSGVITVPQEVATYTPSTTIDGYSTTQGGSLTYANGSSFSWLLNLSIYEHNAGGTTLPLKVGNTQISKVYVGTKEVQAIYIGTNKIY